MGLKSSKTEGETNFVSTGSSVFVNENGETITDTFHNVNGEMVRQTGRGALPASGGFISQSVYAPWAAVAAVTVLLAVSFFVFTRSRQANRPKKSTAIVDLEKKLVDPKPLYSLVKPRSHHASDALWNIDLLDEAV